MKQAEGYELYYWQLRGRGEQVRLLLNALELPYRDVHVDPDGNFHELRSRGPELMYFGSVPVLADGDFRLAQGPAIMNYLGRKHGLVAPQPAPSARVEAMVLGAEDMRMAYFRLLRGDARATERRATFLSGDWPQRWLRSWEGLLEANGNGRWLVGGSFTQADIALWDALDAIIARIEGATLAGYPRVADFFARLPEAIPGVSRYLASDRRLPFPVV